MSEHKGVRMTDRMRLGESKVVFVPTRDDESDWIAVVTAAKVETFRPGQKWSGSKGTFSIVKKWDKLFVVRDKYGDEKKYSEEDLKKFVKQQNLKLVADKKLDDTLKKVVIFLTPFLGPRALVLINMIRALLGKTIYSSLKVVAAPAEYVDQETGWGVQEGEKILVKNLRDKEIPFYVFRKSAIEGMLLISRDSPELYPPLKPVKDLKNDMEIFSK